MSVEVERKFLFNADTLKTLEDIGVCVGQRQFNDQYYDTPQFHLTLRDMWLRKRKGCWELKCQAASGEETDEAREEQSKASALCTRYKEITNLSDIQQRLRDALKDTGSETAEEDELWLKRMNLVCFAEFTTLRRSFTLKKEGVQIDLDQADFGYDVGEIEVLIPEGGDVQDALEKIQRAAETLGLTGDQRVEGKMSIYLKRNHPDHYAKLLSERIL